MAKRKIRSRTKSPRVTLARDELCRRLRDAGFSYGDIGSFLTGGRYASTIYDAIQRARERLQQSAA